MRLRALSAGMCVWGATLCIAGAVHAGEPVKVVATIFPLADLVRQIGKEHVNVVTLLPPGASPHTFEPTTAQMRDVSHAQLCVCVGAGLDSWAVKLLAARAATIAVVTITDGVRLLDSAAESGGDPHVWLDPVLVRDHAVPALRDALRQADPGDAELFTRNAAELSVALSDLDGEIRRTLASLASREYVAFHSAWRYFGTRYDLHEVAAVEPFPGKEPSAREIATLIDKARATRTRLMLIEPQFNPRTAQQIAREFGGRVASVDPIGGHAVAGRDTYVALMRYNAQAFAKGVQ